MAALVAFSPNTSITVAASATQAAVTVLGNGHYMRFVNVGPGNIYVAFYEAGTTPPTVATNSALLIPPGAIEVFSVASDATRVALLGDSSGATVNITRGEGQ